MTFDVLREDLEVQRYAFVEASAGTGKTFAIEHLVARLVMEGLPISRILVMTFTNAAQSELLRRIHTRILAALEGKEGDKKRYLQAALHAFHEARITTIHGFCESLLRKYAFEAEISTAFFEAESQESRFANIRHYLLGQQAHERISLSQLRLVLQGNIETLVKEIAQRSPQVTRDKKIFDYRLFCSELQEALRTLGAIDKQKFLEDFEALQLCYNKMGNCKWQAELFADWLMGDPCATIDRFLGKEPLFWDLVCEENRNKRRKENPTLHYPDLPHELQKKLTPLFSKAKNYEEILEALAAGYRETRGTERVESPDDFLSAMKRAIEKPRFFEKVRKEFDAAIIDEFQDTDAVQWSIFEKLFHNDRPLKALYLVGDPKQSIYAFRNADLYSYLRARDAFKDEERLHLGVNYRSEKSLIGVLNTLFSQPGWMPLPKTKCSLEISSVAAAEKAEDDSLGEREGLRRRGSLHFLLIEAQANARGTLPIEEIQEKQVVPFLADEIRELLKKQLFPMSRIALLVKDRNQANLLINELKERGLAAVFVRSAGIVESPVFPTLLALFHALNRPRDTLWLKRFLISPLMNWSPEEIAAAQEQGRFPELLNLLHQLKEIYTSQGLTRCLQKALWTRFTTSTSLFEKLISPGDASLYEEFLQIQELLMEEISCGERSLLQLVDFLEKIRLKNPEDEKKLQRRRSETTHALTVMTMHASKGLEFDVVFALGLALRSPLEEESDAEEKDAEKMRLLYVAKTRAKRRLYVPLIIDKKQAVFKPGRASPIELFCARWMSPISSYSEWLQAGASLTLGAVCETLQRLAEQASLTWDILSENTSKESFVSTKPSATLPLPKHFSPFWKREEIVSFSSLFQKTKTLSLSVSVNENELPLGADTGNIVHVLMEDVFRKGWHQPIAADSIGAHIDGVTAGTKFSSFRTQLLHMVLSALQLPITPLLPGYASFTLSEVSSFFPEMEFYYPYGVDLCKGFIDLCFMHEGLYYIVDWKTNCLPAYTEPERNAVMEENGYRFQAALYADALRRYVKLFDNRSFDSCFGGAHYLFMRGQTWESFLPKADCDYV